MPAPSKISAVIVALEQGPRLDRCLDALRSHSPAETEVICVHSAVGAMTTERRDGVRIVHAGLNVGWPDGCHVGRLEARSPLLWFLQDDVIVGRGAGEALRAALMADDDLVAVRPVVVNDAGQIPPGSCGAILDITGEPATLVPERMTPAGEFTPPDMLS